MLNCGAGLKPFYLSKIEELSLRVNEKAQNIKRLEAQRNEYNT